MKNLNQVSTTLVVAVVSIALGVFMNKQGLFESKKEEKKKEEKSFNVTSKKFGSYGQSMLEDIKKGGYIFYIRHAEKGSKFDSKSRQAWDYSHSVAKSPIFPKGEPSGVCLTTQGKYESILLGKIFKQLNVPVGEVYTSPVCRCVQTAKTAFGKIDKELAFLVYRNIVDGAGYDLKEVDKLKEELVTRELPKGKNRVIVAHQQFSIDSIDLNIKIAEAAVAIIKMHEGKAHLVRVMHLHDWAKLLKVKKEL